MAGRPKGIRCPALIKDAVARAGSQSALALEVRVTRQAVSMWVLGNAWPTREHHAKLVTYVHRLAKEVVHVGR